MIIKRLSNFIRKGSELSWRHYSKESENWLSSLFVRKLDPVKEAHSDILVKSSDVYELQIHKVKPDCMKEYITIYSSHCDMIKNKETGAELMGSWTTEIGEQDTVYHLWQFRDYPNLDKHYRIYRKDGDFDVFRRKRNQLIQSRKNQICFPFSFWPQIKPRQSDDSIFELRSYTLKPGTMIEWGNHWARGIRVRKEHSQPIAGLFTHVGDIHMVHHIWAYKDLEHRKKMRSEAWRKPGWDECVLHTVPLIRHMNSNILRATPFSLIY